ncbi:MAG: hypothetical protein MJE63_33945 [Proteobacteria bacterium]|nr:hypothetical protein [Pseudomonadota bacterium]
MKTKRTAWGILFTMCISFFAIQAQGDEIYHYQGKVGERVKNFTWQLTKSEFDVISTKQYDFTFTNVCKHNGETVLWEVEGPKTSVRAHRAGNLLIIQGTKHGEKVDHKWKIDSSPWYQPLTYSLRQFSKTDQDTVSFWTLRFDNLKVRKLRAKKQNTVELMVGEIPVKSQLIEVKLKWGLSVLWNASYWFRAGDGVFLRYESVHGFPGTDKTIIAMEPNLNAKQFANKQLEP